MVKQYRKKPVVIEAVQWTGRNLGEIMDFSENGETFLHTIDGVSKLHVCTLEGNMLANIGDYIIRGVKGEFYPCKPDIFEVTYEEVTQ